MDKKELRSLFIEKRLKINEDNKRESDKVIFDKLIKSDFFINSDVVLTYVSTKTEVDTRSLIEYSLMKGKTVAVPRCDKSTNIIGFYRIKSLDDLEKGFFNILEPDRFCSELVKFKNALCIVPGLAFDKKGFRLGYGRGYYDRFLSSNDVNTVGLCYREFLVDELPVEGFDIAVDLILTD